MTKFRNTCIDLAVPRYIRPLARGSIAMDRIGAADGNSHNWIRKGLEQRFRDALTRANRTQELERRKRIRID